jgi:hypothetical protein
VWVDFENNCATFPLWGFDGRLRGFQQYRPGAPKKCDRPSQALYFTWSSQPCLWGLEELPVTGTVFVCESIFKAAAARNAGFAAVSANGSGIAPSLLQQMLALRQLRFVAVGDDDPAGEKFSRTFGDGVVAHDLDELSREQVAEVLGGR